MWCTDNQLTLTERTHYKSAHMDQLHKNRFQVAKHRPGLDVKAELLFKITAKGHLESKRERCDKVQSVLLLVGKQRSACPHTHAHAHVCAHAHTYTHSLSFPLTMKVSCPFLPSRPETPLEQPSSGLGQEVQGHKIEAGQK